MSHMFSEVSSTNPKKVIDYLTRNLNKVNMLLAYNGLFRFEDNLVCGKSRIDVLVRH